MVRELASGSNKEEGGENLLLKNLILLELICDVKSIGKIS